MVSDHTLSSDAVLANLDPDEPLVSEIKKFKQKYFSMEFRTKEKTEKSDVDAGNKILKLSKKRLGEINVEL